LVVLAVALGAVVVILVNLQFSSLESKANPPTTTFYRALRDIPANAMTLEEATGERDPYLEPIPGVPESFAVAMPDAIDEKKLATYRDARIVRPLQTGGILRIEHLSEFSEAEVTNSIPEGHSAVAIEVAQHTAVGYLATPGDRVDVYVTRVTQDESERGGVRVESDVVVRGVLVLAVDGQISGTRADTRPRRGEPYSSVTIAALPDDIRRVLNEAELGKLTLAIPSRR
jgi:Flp pilus assembly protein CpaB